MKTLLVKIWSDFSCPFCYLAKKNFSDALSVFPGINDIELRFKAFQIDPNFEKPIGAYSLLEHISKKYGQSHEKTQRMFADIEAKARESELEIHFSKVIHVNTFFAHKLLKKSEEMEKSQNMVELLFEGYFRDGLNIGDRKTLENIAEKVGFSAPDVTQAFNSAELEQAVVADIREALEIGVSGVPYMLFAGKYPISGMRSQQEYANILKMVHHEWKQSQ